MEMVDTITIEIDGKEYFLVDSLTNENNTYNFFANLNDVKDIQVLKEEIIDGEKFYISIDSDIEFDKALALYYNKIKKQI